MNQQTEPLLAQINLNPSEVLAGCPIGLQEPAVQDSPVEKIQIPGPETAQQQPVQPSPNTSAGNPAAKSAPGGAGAGLIVISDESSKSDKVQENGQPKGQEPAKKVAAEPEIPKETNPQPEPKGQKCWNKLCCSNEALRKMKSKVDERILMLCQNCAASYSSMKFCEVCQQIYPSEDSGDGLRWVQCETESCGRWNHIPCETRRGRYGVRSQYFCSECERKSRRKRLPVPDNPEPGRGSKERKPVEAPESRRVRIFDIRKDNYHYLQPFLSTYSYRLALAEDAITHDLHAIRQRSSSNSELVKRNIDTANKKKKR